MFNIWHLFKKSIKQDFLEAAFNFAEDKTFTSMCCNSLDYPDEIIEDLYADAYRSLKDMIPTARRVKRNSINNSDSLLIVRCFATRINNDIIYGTKVWIRAGARRWLSFNPYVNEWDKTKYIPSNSFYAICYNPIINQAMLIERFNNVRDFFFVF